MIEDIFNTKWENRTNNEQHDLLDAVVVDDDEPDNLMSFNIDWRSCLQCFDRLQSSSEWTKFQQSKFFFSHQNSE